MFTGIVTQRGRVAALDRHAGGIVRIVIETDTPIEPARIGDSVSVSGTCLTVTAVEDAGAGARYAFDAIPETLRRTTLGTLVPGHEVNLETALRVGDALGGHWVQGHVDGVGRVVSVEKVDGGDDVRVAIAPPAALAGDLIPKGSVTIDGVSLTVGEVRGAGEEAEGAAFSVYLIPHTLEVTTLSQLVPGASVNLEMDVMGRWVAHHLARLMSESAKPVPPVTD